MNVHDITRLIVLLAFLFFGDIGKESRIEKGRHLDDASDIFRS